MLASVSAVARRELLISSSALSAVRIAASSLDEYLKKLDHKKLETAAQTIFAAYFAAGG